MIAAMGGQVLPRASTTAIRCTHQYNQAKPWLAQTQVTGLKAYLIAFDAGQTGIRGQVLHRAPGGIGNREHARIGECLAKVDRSSFFSLMLLSGCATKTVYFKDEVEKSVNSERYKVMAPGIYAATKQNFLWFSDAATSDSEFGGLFFLWVPFNGNRGHAWIALDRLKVYAKWTGRKRVL